MPRAIVLSAVFCSVLPFLNACGGQTGAAVSPSTAAATEASTAARQPSTGPSVTQEHFELQFLIDSIDQHQLMIEMGESCVATAVHTELRSYCQMLVSTQTTERNALFAWLQQWLGVTHVPELGGNDRKILSKLDSLAGGAFEQEFLDQTIRQWNAVDHDASQCEAKAFHPELLTYCSTSPAADQAAQLEAWLCQWYSRCKGGKA